MAWNFISNFQILAVSELMIIVYLIKKKDVEVMHLTTDR